MLALGGFLMPTGAGLIRIAESDREIAACLSVMQVLRPQVDAGTFVERVRRQGRAGYRLAYRCSDGPPLAVAGFRLAENLAWGRFLYVDDLVTLPEQRSAGHGAALLRWLADHARAAGCRELHLDSGVQPQDAHRFYRREGLELSSYHFRQRFPA
jgi:GNAT superfamily N-acetyltransferase